MTPPRGYGWTVRPDATYTAFTVVDTYTNTPVTTVPTRKEAWSTVTALSNARTKETS